MRLLRRLDDAVCAFATGHSRRDLDRVRRKRFRLLAERLVRGRERRLRYWADAEARWPRHYEQTLADCRAELQTAADLLQDIVDGLQRIAGPVLLRELEIDRLRIDPARVGRRAQVDLIDGAAEQSREEFVSLLVPADECYGKLYEGLLQYGILDAFQYKLGVCVGHVRTLCGALRREMFDWSSYSFVSSLPTIRESMR